MRVAASGRTNLRTGAFRVERERDAWWWCTLMLKCLLINHARPRLLSIIRDFPAKRRQRCIAVLSFLLFFCSSSNTRRKYLVERKTRVHASQQQVYSRAHELVDFTIRVSALTSFPFLARLFPRAVGRVRTLPIRRSEGAIRERSRVRRGSWNLVLGEGKENAAPSRSGKEEADSAGRS